MASDSGDRALGNLEGRVEEQSALVHPLHADITTGFQQVNNRIDKLVIAVLAIGSGVLAALIGIIATLLVMMAQGG